MKSSAMRLSCLMVHTYGDIAIPSEVEFDGKKYPVTAIADRAFKRDDFSLLPIYSVEIPASVRTIGEQAFSQTALTEIEIPETVMTIGNRAFSNGVFKKAVMYGGKEGLGTNLFAQCYELESVIIGDGHTVLTDGMFSNCGSLQYIEIPDGVTEIGGYDWSSGCFAGCYALAEVKLSKNLNKIGGYAFYGCTSLTDIDFPDSLEEIGPNAFQGCSSLKGLKIGRNLKTLGNYCFSGLLSLESITVNPENQYFSSFDGILADKGCTELILAPTSITGILTLPSSVRVLRNNVFQGCDKLTGLVLNNGLEKIGSNFISGCASLTDLIVPSTVDEIMSYAFYQNSLTEFMVESGNQVYSAVEGMLTDKSEQTILTLVVNKETLTLPSSIVTIGRGAFGMSDVKELICNEGLQTIGIEAFRDAAISKIKFPSTLASIEAMAFMYCSELKSITIPPSVTELGESMFKYSGLEEIAFTGGVTEIPYDLCNSCFNLKRIDIKGVEKIGSGAFGYCAFDSICLPESVTHIDRNAFTPDYGNTINYVKSFAKVPPVLAENVFGWNTSNMEVLVPESSLDLYRNADVWKDFLLTGFDDSSSVMPAAISAADHWTVYGLDGHLVLDTHDYGKVRTLAPGLYIVNGRKHILH